MAAEGMNDGIVPVDRHEHQAEDGCCYSDLAVYTTPLHMTFPNTPGIIHKPSVYIKEIDQGITTRVASKSAMAMFTNMKLVSDLTSGFFHTM